MLFFDSLTYLWILSASAADAAIADGSRADGSDRLDQEHDDEDADRGNDNICLRTNVKEK